VLILLDIDGVMVPAKGWTTPELLNDGFPVFSSRAISSLQKLLSDTVTIILTTSHKSKYSIKEWKGIFNNRGIQVKNLLSLPENIKNLNRKDEIINWFNLNNVDEAFVIIDDDKSLNELPDFLKMNLVQTSPYIGLTEEHFETINSILNNGSKPEKMEK